MGLVSGCCIGSDRGRIGDSYVRYRNEAGEKGKDACTMDREQHEQARKGCFPDNTTMGRNTSRESTALVPDQNQLLYFPVQQTAVSCAVARAAPYNRQPSAVSSSKAASCIRQYKSGLGCGKV